MATRSDLAASLSARFQCPAFATSALHVARGRATATVVPAPGLHADAAAAPLVAATARLAAASVQSACPVPREALLVSVAFRYHDRPAARRRDLVAQALVVDVGPHLVALRAIVTDARGATVAHATALASLTGPPLVDTDPPGRAPWTLWPN